MAVKFYLEKRSDKSGDNSIRVSISINGNRHVTSTGFSINSEKWNNGKVKKGSTNSKGETSKIINARLKEIDSFFSKQETLLKLGDIQEIDIKTLFAENFAKKKLEKTETTFFGCYDEFTVEMGKKNNWTKAVYEKFDALKNHITTFNPNIKFSDLNEKGLNDFVDYLHTVVVAGKKTKERDTRVFGMRNTTIKKQLGFLKWFLKWATQKGYTDETSFQTYKPKLTTNDKKVVFLDWDELMKVYNYDLPEYKKYLERVRDVFCFCCFTSLRYSDVANLKRSDVFDNYISITTIKTADSLIIELNDYSKAILKKYEKDKFPYNHALPVISNQRMNEYLKELGELCGIDEPVTITYYKGNKRYDEVYPKYSLIGTHTARRTFISNALMMGIPPQTVMKWTGHSDYKAMKPYIDIADKAKAESMKLFNKK